MEITEEIIREYKSVMENILQVSNDRDAEAILQAVEEIVDSTSDLIRIFESVRDTVQLPGYWLGIIRIIKMSLVLKNRIVVRYDDFVNVYQKLQSRHGRSKDEDQLLTEVGDFLYKVDTYTGDHERLTVKILKEMRQGIQEDFGLQNTDITDKFYRLPVGRETIKKIEETIRELYGICDAFIDMFKIMNALERVRSLIL